MSKLPFLNSPSKLYVSSVISSLFEQEMALQRADSRRDLQDFWRNLITEARGVHER